MFIILRSSSIPFNADPSNPKPVIVRVKRKSSQSPLEAFCERPGEESDAESSRESSYDDLDGHPKNIQTN
ncbi:hypothetical protein Syun_031267 [Stephania yunnanensis]|uniref:Uncharacterized protein n=1 Tax=Stephania yunnanensis TaxID=152371 RepID=A0AAP0DX83_9MAGN